MKKLKLILIPLLIGITIFSIYKYVLFVKEKYDWAVIMPLFENLVERVGKV